MIHEINSSWIKGILTEGFKKLRVWQDAISLYIMACRTFINFPFEHKEDGSLIPESLAGANVSVFVGLFMHDYENIHCNPSEHKQYGPHSPTGMSTTIAANRISFVFNFKGPYFVMDTAACSSSLVAVYLACQSLLNNESELAAAGGVNVLIKQEMTMVLCEASMLSPEGYCKSFDDSANGYTRSEGAGMVVLRRLSQALADSNPIYAVIRVNAEYQDGRSEGLTVPNRDSQKVVLQNALQKAGIAPNEVQYVEAHGTGTSVGDPIEAKALGSVLLQDRPSGNPCIIGSVKSNFGHTESAAGIASLIKVALMLKHHKIPPNLHFKRTNTQIPFEELRLRIPNSLESWEINGSKSRIAGINSFGFGGTNAHVVLEEIEELNDKDINEPVTVSKDSTPQKEKASFVPLSAPHPKP